MRSAVPSQVDICSNQQCIELRSMQLMADSLNYLTDSYPDAEASAYRRNNIFVA
jgi:hypothetical protein